MVCLFNENGHLLTLDRKHQVNLGEQPHKDLIKLLIKSTVNIYTWNVINHFRDNVEKPPAWKKVPYLHNCFFAGFEDGVYSLDDRCFLLLDEEMGLRYVEDK